MLVNCAGAFFRRRRVTVDGLEMTFALNHLAYFLLTNLLLDSLERSGSARVLNVTAPATTKIDFDDLQGERRYSPFTAFGASKAAHLVFTFELAHRLEGTGVTANAVHPGRVRSKIMREAPAPFRLLTRLVSGSAERAGGSIADLATAPEFANKTGRFYRDRKEIRASAYTMRWESSAGSGRRARRSRVRDRIPRREGQMLRDPPIISRPNARYGTPPKAEGSREPDRAASLEDDARIVSEGLRR